MSIVNIQSLKQLGCQLWWPGTVATSGTYDDDGNKQGFLILPDGVTVTPAGTFTSVKCKDGREVWKFSDGAKVITSSGSGFGNAHSYSTPFTICGWINVSSYINNYFEIFYMRPSTDTNYGLQIFVISPNGVTLTFLRGNNSVADRIGFCASPIPAVNTWYHFAIVHTDQTLPTITNVLIYINGNNAPISDIGANFNFTNVPANGTLIGDSGYAGYGSDGNIKDLMIFKKALTLDQIGQIYSDTFIY